MYAVEQYEVYCGRGSSHEKKYTSLSVTDGRTDGRTRKTRTFKRCRTLASSYRWKHVA